MSTNCPNCGRYIKCPSCASWICPACGADLGATENVPFTDTSKPDDEALLDIIVGKSEWLRISPEHCELIASGEEASPDELQFVERMLPVQRDAMTGTWTEENETITTERR